MRLYLGFIAVLPFLIAASAASYGQDRLLGLLGLGSDACSEDGASFLAEDWNWHYPRETPGIRNGNRRLTCENGERGHVYTRDDIAGQYFVTNRRYSRETANYPSMCEAIRAYCIGVEAVETVEVTEDYDAPMSDEDEGGQTTPVDDLLTPIPGKSTLPDAVPLPLPDQSVGASPASVPVESWRQLQGLFDVGVGELAAALEGHIQRRRREDAPLGFREDEYLFERNFMSDPGMFQAVYGFPLSQQRPLPGGLIRGGPTPGGGIAN